MLFGLDWADLLVIAHVAAAALGVGAATASDSVFLRAIRNRLISSGQFLLITSVSDVVLTGLAGVVVTGAGLLLLTPDLLGEPRFQAKMIVVGALLVNGIGFHTGVIPFLEEHRDVRLDDDALSRSRQAALAGSGTLSAVSWYAALVLGTMPGVDWPLIAFLAVYTAMLVFGAFVAFLVMRHVTPELTEREKLKAEHRQEHGATRWEVLIIGVLIAVFAGSIAAVALGLT